ncbi:nuclear transport factor 2 family protein, partial [Kitasatospora sp. NPDC047058]|uniref:nuclear transport factor 2 family protein n=1 Tax=Kitasatospora sp. NPDC047058 TaxID=3155620 RepID=UPI0033D072B2
FSSIAWASGIAGSRYGGVYRGPSGIERFMAEMSRYWSSLEFLEHRFVFDGDSAVVFNRGTLTARDSGRRLETAVMQLMTVRGDRIAEIRPFYWDTVAVARTLALGSPGPDAPRARRSAGERPDAG